MGIDISLHRSLELRSLYWNGISFPTQNNYHRRHLPVPLSQSFLTTGLCMVVMGQMFRTLAMIHASSNFSHQIAYKKDPNHILVTSGVYSLVRHPSYFGFFWWAVGLQVFLANPVSTIIFVAVLWKFFSDRIQYS